MVQTPTASSQTVRDARWLAAWLRFVVRPLAGRLAGLWVGLGIVGGVVLGGNGLAPAAAVGLVQRTPSLQLALLVVWAALTHGLVAPVLAPQAPQWLASLPHGRGVHVAGVFGWLVVPSAPLAVVAGLGAMGPASGSVLARALVALKLSGLVLLACGVASALPVLVQQGVRAALVQQPEANVAVRRAPPHSTRRQAAGLFAQARELSKWHLRALWREHGASLIRAGGFACLAGMLVALVAQHNRFDAPGDAAVLAALFVCAMVPTATALLAAMGHTHFGLRPMLVSLGGNAAALTTAWFTVALLWSAVAFAVAGVGVAVVAPALPWQLWAHVWVGALALLLAWLMAWAVCLRWCTRVQRVGTVALVSNGVAAGVVTLALGLKGAAGLWWAVGLVVAVMGAALVRAPVQLAEAWKQGDLTPRGKGVQG